MTRILFWNVNKRPIHPIIANLCREQEVDIAVLAEFNDTENALVQTLNAGLSRVYYEAPTYVASVSRVKVLSRFPQDALTPLQESRGFAMHRVTPVLGPIFTLVSVHLPSKLYMESGDQAELIGRLIAAIDQREELEGHDRTVVIGDFNMNPFEDGLISSEKLHAVMDRNVARKSSRRVAGESKKFFYNPSWNLLGDANHRPAGTFYYAPATPISYFWNTFDQAMIRPSLLSFYPADGFQLITTVGETSLIRNGVIDKTFSDHLPVLLELQLEYETARETETQ